MSNEIYMSTDIEADGKVPGLSSMLSFATAAYDIDKNLIGTFSRNLEVLPNANPDPEVQEFWDRNPVAYNATRIDIQPPEIAMVEYLGWIKSLTNRPVFVGYPAPYDYKWIDYYLTVYAGENPFGHSRILDVKSFAYAMRAKGKFVHNSKRSFPKRWFDPIKHTHIAIDDAVEQGAMFINMLRENQGLPAIGPIKWPE